MGTGTVTVQVEGEEPVTLTYNVTGASPSLLKVGASKGSVGYAAIDAGMGKPASPLRVFEQAIPSKWSATDDLPADGRPVLVSITGDRNPDSFAAGSFDAAVRAWLGGAPAGTMAAVLHEGDAKVRSGTYTKDRWIACQEHILPVIASCGVTPVAIITYQSIQNGDAATYITQKMASVPGFILGMDTYQPGTPSATIGKMVQGMDDLAASYGVDWCIPEIGIGINNGSDADRASKLQAILAWCASAQRARRCRGVMYWPNLGDKADYTPGPATWAVLGADYPIGG